MTLPARALEDVSAALARRGLGSRIARLTPVGGGSINHAARIETDTGAILFLKWNPSAPVGMFAAEADGLAAIRTANAVRAPEPITWGETGGGGGGKEISWLLLEHVSTGTTTAGTSGRLGRSLAALHASTESHTFGWTRDNWIGSLPQDNASTPTWADFWRDRRIAPQLARARHLGHLHDAALDRVLDVIPDGLGDVARPELVHGDLWGGNWLTGAGGEPVLVDPAVYLGHGEVDLAMSELFGGFDKTFYDAYRDARGIPVAYGAYRRDLYQLYYLLVHVNLFGTSYEGGTLRAARRVVSELGG